MRVDMVVARTKRHGSYQQGTPQCCCRDLRKQGKRSPKACGLSLNGYYTDPYSIVQIMLWAPI